ncbi:MAG: LacI family DNA-binding transcriptional regulator [Dermatophilus congolensis]|nr:LacI family DNA-binding transcriptional regulator [Dermatophilus congolensis]
MPPRKGVTIYDVAQRAGVSKSLVSLVLQNSPKVGRTRREAVLAAIDELDYRPSRAAAALAGSRTRSLGVVIDDFSNPWYVGLLDGLHAGLEGSQINVSVSDQHLNAHRDESPVDGFIAARVDALLIAGELAERECERLARLSIPTVIAGIRSRMVPGADVVRSEERRGAALAVEHLVKLGHRRIAYITGRTAPAAERENGYREQMKAAGLAPVVVGQEGRTNEPEAYHHTRALLTQSPHDALPTAILAANDTMAMGVAGALREKGLSIPGDVSLVGYDNSPLATSRLLDLTSVDNHNTAVGEASAQLLRGRIENLDTPAQVVSIDTELVIRGSTAAVHP